MDRDATMISMRTTLLTIGDKLQIGYQRERMTITSVYVTHIVGSGSLTVQNDSAKK